LIGAMNGEGGDPAEGASVYQQRCASCHDNPTGRTPAKAVLEASTRPAIATALAEGIMAPMARGLSPHQIASVAAYLSKRTPGTVTDVSAEAPLCQGKPPPMSLDGPQWNGWGVTPEQPRFQPKPGFKAAEAPKLKLKWAFAYPGSRNGQATVVGGRVFLTSFSGAVYALNAKSGCAYWRFDADAGARTSVVVGQLPAPKGAKPRYALYLTDFSRTAYALDAETGAVLWKARVDDQREVQMTGSPTLHEGRLFIPVSSAEEAIATDDAYECCHFRGAVVAVSAATGQRLWKTYMTPGPARPFRKNAKGVQMYGPAGGAIWSAPTVDAKRGLIYVATGDSYTDVAMPYADAIVALDEATGAVRWARQLTAGDNYIIGCGGPNPRANCPKEPGPDVDFGASPILHTLPGGRQLILAGQKSSQVYALDPDAEGKVVWERRLSDGGPLGGVEFGMAADAQTLYVAIADVFSQTGKPKPQLAALRILDGEVLWTTPSPKATCAWKNPFCSPALSQAVSAMPGLVFAGAMDGRFRAFDAKAGKVVWEVNTADPAVPTVSGKSAKGGVLDGAGPTIAGGMVYVNSGYQGRSGVPGNVLLAYSVDGK
jgi:polyvinyl alcohol dehydrogenase (cytochrome)